MSSATGVTRAADALLRSLGGTCVSLRIPTPLLSGGTPTEIGLAPPLYQDIALAPAVLRSLTNSKPALARARYEILISASAVQNQMDVNNFDSADDFFASALGLIYQGDLLRIENVARDDFAGSAYLYRVTAWLSS